VANSAPPFHLSGVTNKLALEASKNGIRVCYVDSFLDPAPNDLERNPAPHRRRSTGEYGILTSAVIEDRNLARLQASTAIPELNLDASDRNFDRPEQAKWRESSRIEIMQLFARTGQKDIDSNEAECGLMDSLVRASKGALHKPHIIIDERQSLLLAGLRVCLCHLTAEIRETNEAVEVRNGCRLGIDRITSCGGTRAEDVVIPVEPLGAAGNGDRGKRPPRMDAVRRL